MTELRCHWVATKPDPDTPEQAVMVLIPGCWARVHDPDAACLCGQWSEESAAVSIRHLRNLCQAYARDLQEARHALSRHGLPLPIRQTPHPISARHWRDLHKSITEAMA